MKIDPSQAQAGSIEAKDPFAPAPPGYGLTSDNQQWPWGQPPKIVDPEEAIAMHMSKFNDPEVIDNMLDLLELGFPVRALAESILTASVAAGWHNIDISLIIAPLSDRIVCPT